MTEIFESYQDLPERLSTPITLKPGVQGRAADIPVNYNKFSVATHTGDTNGATWAPKIQGVREVAGFGSNDSRAYQVGGGTILGTILRSAKMGVKNPTPRTASLAINGPTVVEIAMELPFAYDRGDLGGIKMAEMAKMAEGAKNRLSEISTAISEAIKGVLQQRGRGDLTKTENPISDNPETNSPSYVYSTFTNDQGVVLLEVNRPEVNRPEDEPTASKLASMNITKATTIPGNPKIRRITMPCPEGVKFTTDLMTQGLTWKTLVALGEKADAGQMAEMVRRDLWSIALCGEVIRNVTSMFMTILPESIMPQWVRVGSPLNESIIIEFSYTPRR